MALLDELKKFFALKGETLSKSEILLAVSEYLGIVPERAPGLNLGAPTKSKVYFGGPGTYLLNGISTPVVDELSIFFWNKTSWEVLGIMIKVEGGEFTINMNDTVIGTIEPSNGGDIASTTANRTPYIPVIPGDHIQYSLRFDGPSVFFYDKDKRFISSAVNTGTSVRTVSGTILVPLYARFIRAKTVNSTSSSYVPYDFYLERRSVPERFNVIESNILSKSEVVLSDTVVGTIGFTGADFPSTTANRTLYIPILGGDSIEYSLRFDGLSVFFYDKNKVFISSVVDPGPIAKTVTGKVTAPMNARFVRAKTVNSTSPAYVPHDFYIRYRKIDGASDIMSTPAEGLMIIDNLDSNVDSNRAVNILRRRVSFRGSFYIWFPTGDYAMFNLPAGKYDYSVKLNDRQTLYIDTTDVILNTYDLNINLVSNPAIFKVVDSNEFPKENRIVIAHIRNNKMVKSSLFNYDNKKFFRAVEEFEQYSFAVQHSHHNRTWQKRFNLIHLSDIHLGNHEKNPFGPNYLNDAIEAIDREGNNIDAIAITGDLVDGWSISKPLIIDWIKNLRDILFLTDKPILACTGNHDANDFNRSPSLALTREDWNANFFSQLKARQPNTEFGNAYNSYMTQVFDDFVGKVRLISLDMLDHNSPQSGGVLIYNNFNEAVYSQAQIDWLVSLLKSATENEGIIIMNHYPFEFPGEPDVSFMNSGTFVQGYNLVPEIVQAWKLRTTISKTYIDIIGTQNIVVNADFSTVPPSAEFICYIGGHSHFRGHKMIMGNQLMILEDSLIYQGIVYSVTRKIPNTPSESTFSLLSIDRIDKVIYKTCYGACKTVKGVDQRQYSIPYR